MLLSEATESSRSRAKASFAEGPNDDVCYNMNLGGTYLLCNYITSACCCCICLQPVQPLCIPIKGQHAALAAHQGCKAPCQPLLKRHFQCAQASGGKMMLHFSWPNARTSKLSRQVSEARPAVTSKSANWTRVCTSSSKGSDVYLRHVLLCCLVLRRHQAPASLAVLPKHAQADNWLCSAHTHKQ